MREVAIRLAPGERVHYDGDVVEVLALSGTQVTVRNDRTGRVSVLSLTRLVAGCRGLHAAGSESLSGEGSLAITLALLPDDQRAAVGERARHVREVLTGYRSGHAGAAEADEPRPPYAPGVSQRSRYQAKAEELGVTYRTIERWVAGYRRAGEAGLVDSRAIHGRGSRVDARWDEAVRAVLADSINAATATRSAVLARANSHLDEAIGLGVVPRPSTATAYRRLAELTKGTNAVSGSAKGRRSIADRPKGTFGRLRATRPGEYVVLDTQDLDVFALEEVTCRWVGAQLTIAQDLFTRCIVGLRVTPVSTKAVDVAGVLYQAVVPQPAPESWPEQACWPYHGLPQQLVFDETARLVAPVCAPETLIVDNGKVFVSAHVLSICTRLGISIQPAQPLQADGQADLRAVLQDAAARADPAPARLQGPGRLQPRRARRRRCDLVHPRTRGRDPGVGRGGLSPGQARRTDDPGVAGGRVVAGGDVRGRHRPGRSAACPGDPGARL
jgi:putative transposase